MEARRVLFRELLRFPAIGNPALDFGDQGGGCRVIVCGAAQTLPINFKLFNGFHAVRDTIADGIREHKLHA